MTNQLPASGDPFAQAYARNGNQNGAARTGKPKPMPSRQASQEPVDYSGYGFPFPGVGCPPDPSKALEECVRAAQQVLGDTTQRHEKLPYIDPPYYARWECKHVQAVLSTTAAFNGATNAAGVLLQAAETVPGTPPYTPPLLEMSDITDFQALFTLEPQFGFMARIKTWGIDANASGPKSIRVRLQGATAGSLPTPPDPFLSSYPATEQQETFVILQSKQKLVVEVALRDETAGPVLIDFGICYWFWPVNKKTDSRDGTVLRSGYGTDCP